ncbi:MAG: energy-dependent translational throttle protein EttA [Alphaproteobacteria bacterium]
MASYEYVYVMKDLHKSYTGGKKVLEGVHLSFFPGAKIGVLGPNGAGKSTLLRIMAGLDTDFQGEAWSAKGATVGYLPQEPQLDETKTVAENVMEGMGELKQLVDDFNEISMKLGEVEDPDEMMALIEKQGEMQEKIDAADAWDLDRTVEIAMDALRCPPGDSGVEHLSGGEKRRVALCRLLLSKPDLLLLDEPTNHLDAESIAWLERHLDDYAGTVVMITHDRYFLDNVTGWILEIDRGRGIPYEGNYSTYLEAKQKRLEQEGREDAARKKTLARELDWVRQSPKARQAKSKARLRAYDELLAASQDRDTSQTQIVIPTPDRLGDLVIEAEHIAKAYDEKLLIENFSFRLPPGGIVGIVGPNGAGKTTLFRMITGQDTPDKGDFKVGPTVNLGYVDQSRDALDGDKTVWQEISEGNEEIELGKRKVNSRAYTSSFGFKGTDQQQTVGNLSGGQRNRVHLAKMLKTGANVILLDEPTNDLDVETLRALEDALVDFPGCAVVISHDRWFLDRIATHIIAYEGNSEVVFFEGNYEDYEKDLKRRKGEDANTPHRIKYKPLVRA